LQPREDGLEELRALQVVRDRERSFRKTVPTDQAVIPLNPATVAARVVTVVPKEKRLTRAESVRRAVLAGQKRGTNRLWFSLG